MKQTVIPHSSYQKNDMNAIIKIFTGNCIAGFPFSPDDPEEMTGDHA
jgi:hypothetical protein